MDSVLYLFIGMVVGYILRWQDERLRRLEKKMEKKIK